MAIISLFTPLARLSLPEGDPQLLSHSSTRLVLGVETATMTLTGHFTFTGTLGGTMTGVEMAQSGAPTLRIEQISIPVTTLLYGDAETEMTRQMQGADVWNGSWGADTMDGMGGNDTLHGNGGADVLIGGTGADLMIGGAGSDLYHVDSARDQVIERAGEGVDRVLSSVNHTLGANIEALALTGTATIGRGNRLDNTLTGNGADNLLDGGAGRDRMAGGAGNDSYTVTQGDIVTELAGQGIDHVRAEVSWTLGANLETLKLAGTQAISGTGNVLANRITGNDAANMLNGSLGNDTLSGLGGDDRLAGGLGDDLLTGGAGADRFVFNGGRDVITDFQDGADMVLLDARMLGLTSRADVLAHCSDVGGRMVLDLAAGDLIIRGLSVEEFRDSFALI